MKIQHLSIPTRTYGEPIPVAPDTNAEVAKINELVDAVNAGLAESNAIVGGPKYVRYTSSQYYNVPADALTLDRLDPSTILPGNLATVINTSATPLTDTKPSQQYVATIVANGTPSAVQVPAYTGAPAGTTVAIAWQALSTADSFTPLLQTELPAGKEKFAGLALRPLLLAIIGDLGAANTITSQPAPTAQPAAPTSPLVDDTANTFSGLAVSGFASLLEYEGTGFPDGVGWVPLSAANAYQVGNRIYLQGLTGFIAAGTAGLRVAASGSRPAGKPLLTNKDFTGPSVTPSVKGYQPTYSDTYPAAV